jgi:MFS family permease
MDGATDTPEAARPARRRAWLGRNVLALGLVSLLTDVASEMVVPLLPAFLATLGGGALALGWIEGVADLVASALRLLSGHAGDRMRRYRPLVLAGYALSSAVRPLFALAAAGWHVGAVRVADRVGKGLRSSPRDVLLARAVPPEQRAVAFGFHRAMDHLGAALGPLLAFLLLQFWTQDLRAIFWLTAIPGGLAVAAIVVWVRETEAPPGEAPREKAPQRALARFLVPISLFTLAKPNDAFLLLLASAHHAPLAELPLLWIALHVVRTLAATPGGWLADRYGRRLCIGLGWLVHAAVFAALAFAETQDAVRALFVVYGLHAGLAEGAERAIVAQVAPIRRWGAAFGWYHLCVGALTLGANVGFGWLWESEGQRTALLCSAVLAGGALLVLAGTRVQPEARPDGAG